MPSPSQEKLLARQLPPIKPLNERGQPERASAKQRDKANHKVLRKLSRKPHNMECADCTAKMPGWAALPHGVHICINCAQIHRHIGRHISQTKAINTGTYLWYDDEIACMKSMGNRRAAELYAHRAPAKPDRDAGRAVIEEYIRDKYERLRWHNKKFVRGATQAAGGKKATKTKKKKMTRVKTTSRVLKPGKRAKRAKAQEQPKDNDEWEASLFGQDDESAAAAFWSSPSTAARKTGENDAYMKQTAGVMSMFSSGAGTSADEDAAGNSRGGLQQHAAAPGQGQQEEEMDFFAAWGL